MFEAWLINGLVMHAYKVMKMYVLVQHRSILRQAM